VLCSSRRAGWCRDARPKVGPFAGLGGLKETMTSFSIVNEPRLTADDVDRWTTIRSASSAGLSAIHCLRFARFSSRIWLTTGWAGVDSNHRTTDYESAALTAELPARVRGG
jgi:hypothetical protein